MAKAHIYLAAGANVEATDTFASWIDTTNSLVYDMGTVVMTSVTQPQPNTSVGGYTVGNSHLQGILSANTIAVSDGLRGGSVSAREDLLIVSNTVFSESPLVQIAANTNNFTVNANNATFTSNVSINSTKTVLISSANTTINAGQFYVRTSSEFTGTRVDIDGQTLDVTSNTVLTSSTLNANVDVITLGFDGTDALVVNATSDFNANVNIDGALVNITSANTTVGDSGVDKLNVVAESVFSANAAFNGALVNITSTNTTIGNASTDRLNVNAVSDFNANVNVDGILTQTANAVFTGALVNITSVNTTIGDASTDRLNVNAVSDFNANVNVDGILTATNSAIVDNTFTVNGTANVSGATTLSSSLTVVGNTVLSSNTTIGDAPADRLNVNAVSDFNANVNVDGILTQTANAIFSGALVNITSVNTTIGDASTDRLNVNAVSDFNANVNVDGILTATSNVIVSDTLTVNTQANTASLMVRDLTATRVPYVGTAGEIVDSANLSFSGTQLSLTGTMAVTGNETVSGTLGVSGTTTLSGALNVTGITTLSANLDLQDNDSILIGTGDDLRLFHDGSHSYIQEQGAGDLYIRSTGGNINIQTSTTDNSIVATQDGAVTLYHNNSVKFATTAAGASVTGVLAVSGNETVGGTLGVTGATALSSTLGVTGTTTAAAINASGIVNVTNTTNATSNTSAALKTAGGLAVKRDTYIGGELLTEDSVRLGSNSSHTTTTSGNLIVEQNLNVLGTTTFSSNVAFSVNSAIMTTASIVNLSVTGNNTTIGDSSSDVLVINATVGSDIIPTTDVTYNLGDETLAWQSIYANTVYADTVVANVAWSNITSKPDPRITVTLSGDVSGSGNTTLTDLANGSISISTTIQPNSVALGTDTTGNYVGTLSAGTPSTQTGSSGLTITAAAGEGTSATIAHADTSSASNIAVNNSGGTVLQDLTVSLDTFGHVTTASSASVNLDLRYPQTAFTNIAVSGQTTVQSDSLTDTLTLAGAGIVGITTNATTDTITITATEVDTLASVTSRGNTTTNNITVNDLNARNLVLSGNLTISGTTTIVNSETVNIADNIVVLNSNYTGSSPTESGGIEIERGTLTNTSLLWNESTDRWTFTNNGSTFYNIPISTEYDNYQSWTIRDGDTTTYTITSGDTLQIIGGTYITSNFTADDVLTISHDNTTRTNTTSTATPGFSGTFTALDGVTTNAQGHITGVNTKTVTMPPVTNLGYTSATTQGTVTSSTGTNAVIPAATASIAGLVTTGTQTFAGTKTFSSTISGSINGNAATATYANDAGGLRVSSGGAFIIDSIAQTTPVNYLQVRAANTGQDVLVTTAGSDTNIDLLIQTKNAGSITLDTGTGAGFIDLKPGSSNFRLWDDNSSHYYQFVTGNRTANYNITLPAGNVTIPSGTLVPTTGTGATGTWGISVTGNATTATTAGVATLVTLVADNTTNATRFPVFVDASTGNQEIRTDTGYTYNPSTGLLTTAALTSTGTATVGSLTSTGTASVTSALTVKNAGQLVLNYPGVTTAGEAASTWNIDVNEAASNEFRIFNRNANNSASIVMTIPEVGPITLGRDLNTANISTSGAVAISSSAGGNLLTATASVNNGNDAEIWIQKSRNGGVITAGDDIGTIDFRGHNGSGFVSAAKIFVDSTTATGNLGGTMAFYNNGALSMTLLANNDVSFASDIYVSSVNSTGNLLISGDTPGIRLTDTTSGAVGYTVFVNNDQWFVRNNSNFVNVLTVEQDGDFFASGNITAYSDARLKSNVRTIDNALDKVTSMRGVYFDKDGKAGTGVIAQEVEKVLPEAVFDGEYKSVAYGNIVGILIEAIKELKAELDVIKNNRNNTWQ